MPSLRGKAEFSFSRCSIIFKGAAAGGGIRVGKKSAALAPQAERQPAQTPEWHTCTVPPPEQHSSFCSPKKKKGKAKGFPHARLTPHQAAEGLISAEVTAAASASNTEDHTVLALTLRLFRHLPLSPCSPSHHCSSPLMFLRFLSPSVLTHLSFFSPLSSVLHHSALPLSFHIAREGSRGKMQAWERKREGGCGKKNKNWQAPPLSAGDQLQSWLPMKFNPHRIYMPSLTSGKPY